MTFTRFRRVSPNALWFLAAVFLLILAVGTFHIASNPHAGDAHSHCSLHLWHAMISLAVLVVFLFGIALRTISRTCPFSAYLPRFSSIRLLSGRSPPR